jgi:hypothetical protein
MASPSETKIQTMIWPIRYDRQPDNFAAMAFQTGHKFVVEGGGGLFMHMGSTPVLTRHRFMIAI